MTSIHRQSEVWEGGQCKKFRFGNHPLCRLLRHRLSTPHLPPLPRFVVLRVDPVDIFLALVTTVGFANGRFRAGGRLFPSFVCPVFPCISARGCVGVGQKEAASPERSSWIHRGSCLLQVSSPPPGRAVCSSHTRQRRPDLPPCWGRG